jgi:putative component of membrane protein insertase Oxa1/YidC/SpoIIIJ protein YidD
MNSASGHAHSNLPGKRSRTTGDAGSTVCDWASWDIPFCDCNTLVRLSVLLRLAAALAPPTGSGRAALSVLRFYRRRLTRFTPACPSTPSCSAYAEAVVRELGPRRGLAAAADRIRRCGRSPRPLGGLTER